MTLPLRTLTNAGDPLCTPDGQVLSGVHVSFQLVDRYGVETDVWDALTHERVGGEPIVATTNEDGEFSIDLWPNSRGNRPTRYRCTVDHPAFKAFSGTVDDLSLGPLQWVEFMAASATIAPQALGEMSLYRQEFAAGLQTLGTAVEASSDSAEAAAGSATAAGASASQAASQAAAASASAGSAAGSASAAAAAQSAAAASAATASTQAGAAADSAGQSASSASTASTQAGQAATSATLAQQWATRTDAEVVAGQGYGAMKYALDAASSASAASSAASAAAATVSGKVDASDPRLSDAREWTAATVDQAEAEAGTATTRKAWTAQRVRQAMLGWWGGFAAKTTPVDADSIVIADSAASNAPKRLSWANAVAKLKGTFVEGPASSVDGQVMLFDGATGKKSKSSSMVLSGTPVSTGQADTLISQGAISSYVTSRGSGLVTNGAGLLNSNYNFSGAAFVTDELVIGGGSFYSVGPSKALFSDEYIPVSTGINYRMSFNAKGKPVTGASVIFFGVACYDIDNQTIYHSHCVEVVGSARTELAAPLNPGDTTITLADATGWHNGSIATARGLRWYPYTNSKGYTYPVYGYSRHTLASAWGAGGISGNTITLSAPWAGPALAAGTKVSNAQDGGTFVYFAENVLVPSDWQRLEALSGVNFLRPGTANIRLVFLLNYPDGGTSPMPGDGTLLNDIRFEPSTPQVVNAPANSASAGVAGQIAYDGSFIYQCVATNTWKRAALSSW